MLQLPDEKINLRQFWLISKYLKGQEILGFEENPISVSINRQNRINIDYVSVKQALIKRLNELDVKNGDKPKLENKPQQLQLSLFSAPSKRSLDKAKTTIGLLLLGLVGLFGFCWIKTEPNYSTFAP